MKSLLSIRSYRSQPVSHSHQYHQLVLPLRGTIDIQVENFSGKVAPRECVIVRSNQEHLFCADTKARFIVADMEQFPENIHGSKEIVFEINKPLFNYLLFVESQLEYQVNLALERTMYEAFCLLLGEQTLQPKRDPRISNVLMYVEQHLDEPLPISKLAGVAFLSPTQFKKTFKAELGVTAFQHITALRMEKAQALLTHTDYPMQIVGEKVGYRELSAFSRKFTQFFGFSPTKFKK